MVGKIKASLLYQILLLVGAVLVLALIVGVTCCIYRRNKGTGAKKHASTIGRLASGSMNEMTVNPALAGVTSKRWDQI